MSELLQKARAAYNGVLNSLDDDDPTEYEHLAHEWFNNYALQLVETLENHEERGMEKDEH